VNTQEVRPQKVGQILENILSERGYLVPCREWQVVYDWPRLVGERIASVSKCERVEDGILYVRVSSACWRQEIIFIKEEILKVIKNETDCKTIKDIVFY
jgi:predicted nucleic acid-binding Zn ribbon protein